MGNISNIIGSFTPPPERIIKPTEQQLIDAMLSHGLTPPRHIELDGKVHRFCTSGKKGDSGWYIIFNEGVPAGRFGDWRTGIEVSFRCDVGRPLTTVEEMAMSRRMAEARALREEEQRRKHEVASNTVETIWAGGMHAESEHPYLKRKGIYSHGARVTGDGRLMIPLYDVEGKLSSIQYISEDGDKKYHPGGATSECFWSLGEPSKTIYIAEGFATAATVFENTNQHTIISYSASNLVPVTRIIREKFGAMQDIVIVADNDVSGVGQKYADQASAKYGARVIMPPDIGDANDYLLAGGNLSALLNPPTVEWLVPADDFSNQPAPISWLIKGWLQENALIMVHGPSGGGKTFVVLDWCMSMASGQSQWANHKVKRSNVIYLAGEGHAGLRGRVAAWKQKHDVNKLDMWVSKSGCDLNTAAGYQQVSEQLRSLEISPSLIVVDTLHRFLQGDENSAQDTKTMLDACAALMTEFNCSVLLVHHTGVSEEAQHRARGSSAWRGALEIEISIVPGNDERPMEIIQRKSKDSELSQTIYCNLNTVAINGWLDEDGEPVKSAIIDIVDAPVAEKKDSKIDGFIKDFNNAWNYSGCELSDIGMPIISRSALAEYLQQTYPDWSADKVNKSLVPSDKDKFIGSLVLAQIIKANKSLSGHTNYFEVINEVIAGIFKLGKS